MIHNIGTLACIVVAALNTTVGVYDLSKGRSAGAGPIGVAVFCALMVFAPLS